MRFGVFYEHQLPRPWDDAAEERLYREALEQVEIADRAGFDYVWEVEHHFLEEYSHSSASDVFLAAASQRAPRIRLGFGILPTPPAYQHPARVAETVATLDLVSGGRVDFGSGETSSGAELAGFGVERESKRAQWEEGLDAVTRMMVETPFAGYRGRFLEMPPRNVIPKPVQKPHPPLWLACSRRETIRLAAEKGVGALSFSFVEPEEAKEWVDEYHAIIDSERCVPAGFAVNPTVAVVLPMMCHPDEAEAIDRGIDGAHFFGYALAHWYVFGEHHPGRTDIWEEFERRRAEVGFARHIINADQQPLGVKILEEGFGSLRGAIGTPAQIADLCRRYEAAGVDQLIFVVQAGRNRHEHICEALELVGREVLPDFAAGAEEADAQRRERHAEGIVAALARREPPRAADPDYVIAPLDSGPPPAVVGAGAGAAPAPAADGAGGRGAALRRRLEQRGEAAFQALVRRAGDNRLERTAGSDAGLRFLFGAMVSMFVPEKANGAEGDIVYELRNSRGAVKAHTVSIASGRATTHPGGAAEPRLTIRMGVADFVRIAARELDPGAALLSGRMDLEGDFALAVRLGEMFGQPSPI